MMRKLFLSFFGMVLLALILDIGIVLGIYAITTTFSKPANQVSRMVIPQRDDIKSGKKDF